MTTRAPVSSTRLVLLSPVRAKQARERRDSARDERVNRAIALMQGDLTRRWTVSALARAVCLSRPAFARRFVEAKGVSPLRYLKGLRMERAKRLLEETDDGLARVGSLVGYDSEFAFNRAFKRWYGVAPGSYRRALRSAAPVFRAAA